MDATDAKYDAVLFGGNLQKGENHAKRISHALDRVEPFLGGQGYIREVGGGQYLATRSPDDKLLFNRDHDRSGEPRYTWTDGPDGMKLGTKKEGA